MRPILEWLAALNVLLACVLESQYVCGSRICQKPLLQVVSWSKVEINFSIER
jgi:hypothetical protein